MESQWAARSAFWFNAEPQPEHQSLAQRAFIEASRGLSFESRFIGEQRWWPVPAEELASVLDRHYEDLEDCLLQLEQGQCLRSPLAEFRLACLSAPLKIPAATA